jgi:hypothetical protein
MKRIDGRTITLTSLMGMRRMQEYWKNNATFSGFIQKVEVATTCGGMKRYKDKIWLLPSHQ